MNIPEDVLQSTAYWTVAFREASYDIQVTYQYKWKEENKTAYRRYTVKMPLSYDGLVVILHPLSDTYTEYQDGDTGLTGADLDKLGDRIQKASSAVCDYHLYIEKQTHPIRITDRVRFYEERRERRPRLKKHDRLFHARVRLHSTQRFRTLPERKRFYRSKR